MPPHHRGERARSCTSLSRRQFSRSLLAVSLLPCCLDDDRGAPWAQSWRASSGVTVLRARNSQGLAAQHCSLSSDLAGLVDVGDQIRVTRSASEYALYTVVELRDESDPGVVRMASSGRQRLGTSQTFAAVIDTVLTANELDDEEAHAQSEFVERLVDDGAQSGLLVTAVHGGNIEPYTDQQAERIAATAPGVSAWICKGWRSPSGAYARWHITSTELSPSSFPGLASLAGRGFARVVSFHGMSADGVLIGGGAPTSVREQVREAIVAAIADPSVDVRVAGVDDSLSGTSPNNFVNWLSAGGQGGIQIEQSYDVRSQYWDAIADAVVGVLG